MNLYSIYTQITIWCWLILGAYWIATARRVKRTVYKQPFPARLFIAFTCGLGFILVYKPYVAMPLINVRVLPGGMLMGILGDAFAIAGVAFAIWARVILGPNWSANVTLKENHELIQAGPYRIVRHPIYTGFIFALLGAAVTVGQVRGFLGVALLFLSFWVKLKAEEAIMMAQFPDAYPGYRKKVKAVIPYIL